MEEKKKKSEQKKKGDELTGSFKDQSNEIKIIFSVNQYSFTLDKWVEKIRQPYKICLPC